MESVGGKFSDWFKISQGSKPMGDWHAPLNTEQRDSVLSVARYFVYFYIYLYYVFIFYYWYVIFVYIFNKVVFKDICIYALYMCI